MGNSDQRSLLLCVLACNFESRLTVISSSTNFWSRHDHPYRVSRVTGDRYAGEFPRELFRKHGIAYDLAKQTKSELFRDLLPLLNSGRIVLPRNDRLQGQIVGLERRTSAVGRDTISHPDRGHDDVANAVAGAAALSKFGGYDTSIRWVSGDDDSGDAWQRVRLQAFVNSGGRIRL